MTRFKLWPLPFFYGWIIVGVVFLAEFTVAGMGTITISLFFKPMGDDLGWSLTTLTGAVAVQALVGIAISPIFGILLDRFGARLIMLFGALIAGIGLLSLSLVQEIWQFWILYAIVGAFGLHELGSLTGPVVVAKWFIKRRGRAMAIATLGTTIGGMVMAPVIGLLIAEIGWRRTWGAMGICVMALMIPTVTILMRRQPEDLGLVPDGYRSVKTYKKEELKKKGGFGPATDIRETEESWTLQEAFRTRTFWLLILAINLVGFSAGAINIHTVPFFTQEQGISVQAASFVVTLRLLGASLSRIPWGLVVERVPVRQCLAVLFAVRAFGPLSLVFVPYPYNIFSFAVFYGLLGGSLGLLQPIAFANYYGRTFFGSIQGAIRPLLALPQVIGPLLVAGLYDRTGTFELAFIIAAVVSMVASGIVLLISVPVRSRA
ncbi:MFS transporter [SAR202 cluster bacterium AD-802-E10_MRT_200m]|nr:MFS transporter [SAR202 cluster bacterium AD-802-E10_MRT_200m]MQF82778.1 MFS transporter [SAR202 cluster bacterium AD-802-E10_MRT_200m]